MLSFYSYLVRNWSENGKDSVRNLVSRPAPYQKDYAGGSILPLAFAV